MIQNIEIRNFKSIKKKHFALKNLNVLLGLNGQGKSSFIQFLLLLRQSELGSGRLNLSGRYVNIGSTKDAIYQYHNGENLGFDIQFEETQEYVTMKFDYQIGANVFEGVMYSGENSDELDNWFTKMLPFYKEYFGAKKEQGLFANNNFQYLKADRISPTTIHQKNHSAVVTYNNIGDMGEFAVDFLETRGHERIKFKNCIHPKTQQSTNNQNEIIKDDKLLNQVNLWLSEISPNVSIKTTAISSNAVKLEYQFAQPTYGTSNAFMPENVGFGISYALPVITALLAARENELLIIENPESHIHPRGQAELGKLIALVAQNNVQIIVETHSDHILNGIRVAVKEKDIAKENVVAFYFNKVVEPTEQYSHITDIQIDKNGELSDYPKDMLDEWSNQLFKLM